MYQKTISCLFLILIFISCFCGQTFGIIKVLLLKVCILLYYIANALAHLLNWVWFDPVLHGVCIALKQTNIWIVVPICCRCQYLHMTKFNSACMSPSPAADYIEQLSFSISLMNKTWIFSDALGLLWSLHAKPTLTSKKIMILIVWLLFKIRN